MLKSEKQSLYHDMLKVLHEEDIHLVKDKNFNG